MENWFRPAPGGDTPFLDLSRESRRLKAELTAAFAEVVDSGVFLFGPKTEELEHELAVHCGTRYAVAVSSGTAAIEVLMRACGIGPGDEVITPAASSYSTPKAIACAGATPVFADIDPRSCNIDPAHAAALVTSRTRAILAVHLYGRPADVEALRSVASRSGILLFEDAAQAFGASVNGVPAGGCGDAAILSFYPSKNVGALGDAGAIVTSDASLAKRAQSIRFLGFTGERDRFSPDGLLARMDELQAALLLVKLRHSAEMLERRLALAARYDAGLPAPWLRPPAASGVCDVRHLYVIRTGQRDRVAQFLRARRIHTQIHYRVPLHRQPAFENSARSLPVAEQWAREVLSLPLYPDLTDHEQRCIMTAVSEAYSQISEE